MTTQEIKITASITLEVPIELSKAELTRRFDNVFIEIEDVNHDKFASRLEIIDIEEEAEIYGNE